MSRALFHASSSSLDDLQQLPSSPLLERIDSVVNNRDLLDSLDFNESSSSPSVLSTRKQKPETAINKTKKEEEFQLENNLDSILDVSFKEKSNDISLAMSPAVTSYHSDLAYPRMKSVNRKSVGTSSTSGLGSLDSFITESKLNEKESPDDDLFISPPVLNKRKYISWCMSNEMKMISQSTPIVQTKDSLYGSENLELSPTLTSRKQLLNRNNSEWLNEIELKSNDLHRKNGCVRSRKLKFNNNEHGDNMSNRLLNNQDKPDESMKYLNNDGIEEVLLDFDKTNFMYDCDETNDELSPTMTSGYKSVPSLPTSLLSGSVDSLSNISTTMLQDLNKQDQHPIPWHPNKSISNVTNNKVQDTVSSVHEMVRSQVGNEHKSIVGNCDMTHETVKIMNKSETDNHVSMEKLISRDEHFHNVNDIFVDDVDKTLDAKQSEEELCEKRDVMDTSDVDVPYLRFHHNVQHLNKVNLFLYPKIKVEKRKCLSSRDVKRSDFEMINKGDADFKTNFCMKEALNAKSENYTVTTRYDVSKNELVTIDNGDVKLKTVCLSNEEELMKEQVLVNDNTKGICVNEVSNEQTHSNNDSLINVLTDTIVDSNHKQNVHRLSNESHKCKLGNQPERLNNGGIDVNPFVNMDDLTQIPVEDLNDCGNCLTLGTNFNKKSPLLVESLKTDSSGFQTGIDKIVDVSEETLEAARNMFEDDMTIANHNNNVEIGFCTGRGKKVEVSEKSLKAAKKIFEDDPTIQNPNKNVETGFCGFQTGHGKKVEVSEKSLKAAKKIFEDDTTIQNPNKNVETGFCGFQTGHGKKVEVSEKSLKAAKKIFEDDTTIQNPNKNVETGFCGFQTGHGKKVEVSEKSLKAAKKIFEDDTTIQNLNKNVETGFCGFQTGHGKKVEVSEKSLKAAKKIFEDGTTIQNPNKNVETGFCGFQTGHGKKVEVSEKSLKAAKKIFEDGTTIQNPNKNVETGFCGFQTGHGKKVEVSEKSLKAAKKIFEDDTTIQNPNKNVETGFCGFQTGHGKKVEVSEKSLKAAKKIFEDDTTIQNPNKNVETGFCGFQTGHGKKVEVSEKSLKSAKKIFEDDTTIQNLNKNVETGFCGFQTGHGKKVEVSEKSLKAAKKIFEDDTTIQNPNKNVETGFCGFQTGHGKKVEVSEKSLKAAKKIFEDDTTIQNPNKNVETGFCGFQTGHGKKVEVSEKSLKAAKKIFEDDTTIQNPNKNVETGFCGFQTGHGKKVEVSEKSLKAAKKIFEDDTTIQNLNKNVETGFCGFQTGHGKNVEVSEESLKAAKRLFEDDTTISNPCKDVANGFCGFQIGSSKNVEESLKAVDKTFEDDIIKNIKTEVAEEFLKVDNIVQQCYGNYTSYTLNQANQHAEQNCVSVPKSGKYKVNSKVILYFFFFLFFFAKQYNRH